jgi:hypothetical protein
LSFPPRSARIVSSKSRSAWTTAIRRVAPIGSLRLVRGAAVSSSRTSRSTTARVALERLARMQQGVRPRAGGRQAGASRPAEDAGRPRKRSLVRPTAGRGGCGVDRRQVAVAGLGVEQQVHGAD